MKSSPVSRKRNRAAIEIVACQIRLAGTSSQSPDSINTRRSREDAEMQSGTTVQCCEPCSRSSLARGKLARTPEPERSRHYSRHRRYCSHHNSWAADSKPAVGSTPAEDSKPAAGSRRVADSTLAADSKPADSKPAGSTHLCDIQTGQTDRHLPRSQTPGPQQLRQASEVDSSFIPCVASLNNSNGRTADSVHISRSPHTRSPNGPTQIFLSDFFRLRQGPSGTRMATPGAGRPAEVGPESAVFRNG